jgi:hypothetical protein
MLPLRKSSQALSLKCSWMYFEATDINRHPGGPTFHQQGLIQRSESSQTSCKTVWSLNVLCSLWHMRVSLFMSIKGSAPKMVIIQKSYPLLQYSFVPLIQLISDSMRSPPIIRSLSLRTQHCIQPGRMPMVMQYSYTDKPIELGVFRQEMSISLLCE